MFYWLDAVARGRRRRFGVTGETQEEAARKATEILGKRYKDFEILSIGTEEKKGRRKRNEMGSNVFHERDRGDAGAGDPHGDE